MAIDAELRNDLIKMIKEDLVIPVLQIGTVKNIVITNQPQGGRSVAVDVYSFTDLKVIKGILIDQPLTHQYIPVLEQQVILLRIGDHFTRILMELSVSPFPAVEEPGEIVVEGGGGGFFYANNDGDAYMSDKIRENQLKLLAAVGITMLGKTLSVVIKDTGKITVTPQDTELGTEDKIEIEKLNKTGKPTKVIITNDRVEIESSQVSIGRTGPKAGSVVSYSPRIGDHSIDPMTGDPIPRSATVVETVGTPADYVKQIAADIT